MNETANKQRITVRISREVASQLDDVLGLLHLRRDAYLNEILPDQIDRLDELPANSERSERFLRLDRQLSQDRVRIAVTLDSALVDRLNSVCKEKRLIRDQFFEHLFTFLAAGRADPDENPFMHVVSPLRKAHAYLEDPMRDLNADVNIYAGMHRVLLEELFE
jgi:hypothetical protein